MAKKVVMPAAGQTTDVATVTKLLVAVGDQVGKGDVLMEVETDKAVLPIESFAKGFVTAIYVDEFDKVDAGTLLLEIGDKNEISDGTKAEKNEKTAEPEANDDDDFVQIITKEAALTADAANNEKKTEVPTVPAMPNAKKLASELGVDLLNVVPANGAFIKAADVRKAAEKTAESDRIKPDTAVIPTGRMRDAISRRWENSAVIPSISMSVSANSSSVDMLCAESGKVGRAHFVMLALARLSKRYELLRVSYSGGEQRLVKGCPAALAVDAQNGSVSSVVPSADKLGLNEIADICAENYANICRGDLSSADGAAFCVFDLSEFGVDGFIPSLRTPETAAFGVSGEGNGVTVGAAFDIRVWEPRVAASMMKELRRYLEAPALLLI